MTLEKLGLYERLSAKNHVSWHWRIPEGKTGTEVLKEARNAVVYVSSANAIATSGEIVNIDGNGNRVAEILYGHERVYFVVGKNKISKDLNSALWRPPAPLRNPVRETRRKMLPVPLSPTNMPRDCDPQRTAAQSKIRSPDRRSGFGVLSPFFTTTF